MNTPNTGAAGKEPRRLDRERTRQAILAAAREEFAEHGLSGARVDAIAARTNTVKRMIYYYFGSKEGLYLAVLEEAYADIRRFEGELNLDQYPPVEAIRRLIEFTFDYDEAHPDFIRLVATENTLNARYHRHLRVHPGSEPERHRDVAGRAGSRQARRDFPPGCRPGGRAPADQLRSASSACQTGSRSARCSTATCRIPVCMRCTNGC